MTLYRYAWFGLIATVAIGAPIAAQIGSRGEVAAGQPRPTVLSSATDSGWVPMVLSSGVLTFQAAINGRTITALLDTGSSATVIDRRFAASIGITSRGSVPGVAAGGKGVVTDSALGVVVSFGTARLAVTNAQTADLSTLNAARGTRLGAIIGNDALSSGALELDFPHQRFRMSAAALDASAGKSFPLVALHGLPVAIMDLGPVMRSRVLIDTGKNDDLATDERIFDMMAPAGTPETTIARAGLGGVSVARLKVLREVSFAGAIVNDMMVEAESADPFLGQVGADAIVGAGLLRHFDLIIDYAHRRTTFRPAAIASEPLKKSTAGLQLKYGSTSAEVVHVMKNSPAAAAGWRPHDRICSVDAVPVAAIAADPALKTWSIDRAGRKLSIGMCDGSSRQLMLADFY